jgi:hypothetical protein
MNIPVRRLGSLADDKCLLCLSEVVVASGRIPAPVFQYSAFQAVVTIPLVVRGQSSGGTRRQKFFFKN